MAGISTSFYRVIFGFSAALCLGLPWQPAAAQQAVQPEKFAVFGRGGLGFSSYGEGFSRFAGPAECAAAGNGSGSGFTGAAGVELPLFSGGFLSIGAGLSAFGGTADALSAFNARDTLTGTLSAVTLNTSLKTAMTYLAFRPELTLQLLEKGLGGPLRATVGGAVFLPMTSTFSQTESIVSPDNAVFIAGGKRTQSRTIAASDIATAATLFGIAAGVENMIALSGSMHLTQRVGADVILNSAVSDGEWKLLAFRAELGLRYAFRREAAPPPQPPPAPEPVEPPPAPRELSPALSVSIRDVSVGGKEGRELVATPPAVNAVFFGHNSADIPPKYSRDGMTGALPANPLEFHRQILPFIAKLLAENPKGKVEIYGATSGDDEPAGIDLARRRAAAVQNALAALGVSADRIIASAEVFPSVKSSQDLPEGREENRRVDIVLRGVRLLEYVSRQNYADISGTADVEIRAEDLGADTVITVRSGCFAAPLTVSRPGRYTAAVRCRVSGGEAAYTLQLEATNKTMTSHDFAVIPLSGLQKTGEDVQVDNFDAILRFDYNSDELSPENRELLRQMLERMPAGTVITIYGSADALGSQQRNIQLEKNRAAKTEQFIRSVAGDTFAIRTAQQTDKFPENTPEGRFLNRNMRIRLGKN